MAIDKETYRRIYSTAYREGRRAGLEEAAEVCTEPARRLREEMGWSAEAELLERYAAAIRKLKDRKEG